MNDAEYKALVQSAYDNRILIGVDRIFARRLYTNISTSTIHTITGETPYIEKFVIWFAFLASPIAICMGVFAAVFGFRWWAFIVVPGALLLWMLNRSMSVRGGSSMWFLTLILVTAVSLHFMKLLSSPWMSGFIAIFAFALWCDRLLYCASTFFLRAFVLRNPRALEAFGEGITIREAG